MDKMSEQKPKYSFEIDVTDHECDRYHRWACYGTITAEGDTLGQLLETAAVNIMDQDGGDLDIVAADSWEFQKLIEAKYLKEFFEIRRRDEVHK